MRECLAEARLRLGVAPLVGLDLADVVRRRGHVDHVADPFAKAPASLVEVTRLVPAPLVVRLDAEVVEHARLADEVADLFEDRQREAAERVALRSSPR